MKTVHTFLLIIFFVFNLKPVSAQEKIKEGKATITYTYPDKDKISEEEFSRIGTPGCTYYFKNGLTRVEYEEPKKLVYIIHPKEQEIVLINDKHGFKQSFDEAGKSQAFLYGDTIAQVTGEMKMIAGFKCTKAIYTFPVWGKPMHTIEIWFTKDISATTNEFIFRGIDGFILAYSVTDVINHNGEEIDFRKMMTCTKVEKQTVSDELFKIAPDIDIFTRDDVKKVEYH